MADDLEDFIQQQKAQLIRERQELNPQGRPDEPRRKWDRQGYTPAFQMSPPEVSTSLELPVSQNPSPGQAPTTTPAPTHKHVSFLKNLGEYEDVRQQYLSERKRDCEAYYKSNKLNGVARPPPTPEETGLPLGKYDERRKMLQEQRRQEYNARLPSNKPVGDRRPPPTPEHRGLPVGGYEEKRKVLQEERQKEYNELLSKNRPVLPDQLDIPRRPIRPETPEDGGALPLAHPKSRSEQLRLERQREMQIQMAQSKPSARRPPATPINGGALPIDNHDKQRQQLFDERQREMQQQMASTKNARNRAYNESNPGNALPVGTNEPKKAALREELRLEMQKQMSNSPAPRQRPSTPKDGGGLPLGAYEEKKNRLAEERRRDTQAQMKQGTPTPNRAPTSTPQNGVLPLGQRDDQQRDRLRDERQQEYNQLLEQKNADVRKNGYKENVPPAGPTPGRDNTSGMFSGLGAHEESKKKLAEERKREYNEKISQQKVRSTGAVDNGSDAYVSNLPGYKEQTPRKERSTEPNDRLPDEGNRSHSRRRPPLDAHSDEEDEYGRYLRERPPRKGWGTPTYEEILERKRREERSYRRNDDIDYSPRDRYPDRDRDRDRDYDRGRDRDYDRYRDRDYDRNQGRDRDRDYGRGNRLGDPSYLRNSISDGHLNRRLEEEDRRYRELDRDYERRMTSIVSRDPDGQVESYRRDRGADRDDYGRGQSRYEPTTDIPPRVERGREPDRGPPPQTAARSQAADNGYNATLLIGGQPRSSADQRRKASYREELQQQMQQTKAQKLREKQQDFSSPTSGGLPGSRPAPPAQQYTTPRIEASRRPPPQSARLLEDDFSPRSILYGTGPAKDNSILAGGFGQQLFRPNPMLPSYQYQNGNLLPETRPQPGVLPTQYDDPYNFYAQNNPLEGLGTGVVGANVPAPDPLNMPSINYGQPQRPESQPNTSRQPPGGAQSGYFPFGTETKADKKKSYQQDLQDQIEATKRKKEEEKRKQDLFDRKKDEEIRNYDPFGRGGAGAPVKDQYGNIVTNRKQAAAVLNEEADLKKMKAENDAALLHKPVPTSMDPASFAYEPIQQTSPLADLDGSGGHARGGHGIFGEPMTAAQKKQKTSYQEELRLQMEEKKRQQDIEKAKLQEEEAKMLKKIEEDNKRMQQELENEKRKEREKAEEAQKKQEELMRQQEERRKAENEKRRLEEEKRQEKVRQQQEEMRKEREQEKERERAAAAPAARGSSPPVPALKVKIKQDNKTPDPSRPSSQLSRKGSADVLQQLARMKQQLAKEQQRVETDLKSEEPVVFDPRLAPPVEMSNRQVDIFEVAQKNQPVSVRRNGPDPATLRDFNDIKNRSDSATRQNLRSLYPTDPVTREGLEAQQRALLREQEDQLQELGGPRNLDRDRPPPMRPRDLGMRAPSNMSEMLDADTAFVTMSGPGGLPDDLEDLQQQPQRNESARGRRRQKETPAITTPVIPDHDPLGSVISLNPDVLAKRNEERLRRLKDINSDDISVGDPDDILERFMARQVHNRPATASTVADDTWMQPGPSNFNIR